MLITNTLKDYKLLDAGDRYKLEDYKGIILSRPDPAALWLKNKPELWDEAIGIYHRSNKGGGSWEFKEKIKDSWTINYQDLRFKIAPTGFKHTGIFPEQASNWDYLKDITSNNQGCKILNLFAYTGIASMVCSYYGANEVVHLDASKSINQWAKENMLLNHLENKTIRFISDDVNKFLDREIRRGRKYDGIIMDPPSYGRGSNNELFKFEEQINPLIDKALTLLSNKPLFLIVNSYTAGYSSTVMYNIIYRHLQNHNLSGTLISDEIGIKIEDTNMVLPCGITSRYTGA